jgi:hypothetical protein
LQSTPLRTVRRLSVVAVEQRHSCAAPAAAAAEAEPHTAPPQIFARDAALALRRTAALALRRTAALALRRTGALDSQRTGDSHPSITGLSAHRRRGSGNG